MFVEEPNYQPELGQILLSNNQFYAEEAYWATEGLVLLKQVLEESKIQQWNDKQDYEGTKFAYRYYCWCDGAMDGDESHPHYNGCPPNFEHYESGLVITWYKHCGRGVSANMKEPSAIKWFDILSDCVEEIKNYEFN
jgi:hypothetical protein